MITVILFGDAPCITKRHVWQPQDNMKWSSPLVAIGIAVKVSRDVKKKAMHNYFQPAGAIIEQVTFNFIAFKQ